MPEDRIGAGAAAPRGRTGVLGEDRVAVAPLLASKLAVASLPGAVVARPRLFALLESGAAGPVTLVSAPAGWGKTTLLGSWYRAPDNNGHRAWLSLEPGDGGSRLWSYLRAAVRSTDDPQGGSGSPAPAVEGTDEPVDRDFLDHLAAELSHRPEPVTLVLDDFHRIDDPDVADGLEFLLRHTGDRLRLVIGGRTDPALALHRWRLSGELTEIRAADLAFTAAEAAELLTAHGISVPADQTEELRVRTEGWPAGLRFAALALPGHPDPARFVDAFGGDASAVADYLSVEVLAGLTDEARDVLRRGAVADRVTGDLVNALTGRTDGDRVLAELERDTGFVIGLGTRPPAYRYHRMLAELLRAQQRLRPADELLDLHRRAAGWAVARELPAEALRHALAAGEWNRATGILAEHWPELVPYAPARPGPPAPNPPAPEAVRAEPELALAYAVDALDRGNRAAASGYLRLAERQGSQLDGGRRDRFTLIAAALRLAGAQLGGEVPEVLAAAARLRALASPPGAGAGRPPVDLRARAIARTAAGAVQLATGDLVAAETELSGALADAHRAGLARTELACTSRLALVRAVRGRLAAAERDARLVVGGAFDGDVPTDHGHAYLALALIALHRDHAADAEANLTLAGNRIEQGREPAVAALAAWIRAQLGRDRGDLTGAYQLLLAGRARLGEQHRAERLSHWLLAGEADLCTAHGDLGRSRELLLAPLDEATGPAEALAVALSRAYLHAGDLGAVARTLPDWAGPDADAWLLPVRLEAGLLDALTARAAGDHRRAARTLEEVLVLAAPDGFRRVFTRSEPPARDLLAAHLDSGTAYWPMVRELIATGAEQSGRDAITPTGTDRRDRGGRLAAAVPGLGEPLTDRELTVLRYLQSILSNVEIAGELSVSVNTVKTHVRNIYRKLDATRRREAVRRARELRLI
ncbi:LuxR C-terminal-related transcriptional regulator [Micromonospora sp. NPDC004704]